MRRYVFPLIVVGLLCLGQSAFCQATRTWVSGVGDDANPASRTAPALTFAGALPKTAAGGEIDNLDTGDFGPVTINKSITIDGAAGVAGIMVTAATGTPAIVISATTTIEVTLRNLQLNGNTGGGTIGIQVLSPVVLHIENCKIFGFSGHGIDFEPTGGSAFYVKNSHIYSNDGDGIYIKPDASSTISIVNSNVNDCATGIHGDDNTITVVQRSACDGNTGAGFETTAGATMTITNSESSLNGTGISSAGTVLISNVTVTNNSVEGLDHAKGGKIESFHDNPAGDNKAAGAATSTLPLK
ncbi:MAG: right-handed parallel beta-helix repeat-containing protein [Chthoniobacteraceae bacterium]|jgi:hypothetical protein